MKTISFILKQNIPETDRMRALNRILKEPYCSNAKYLSDDAKRSAWRIGHASAEDKDAEELRSFIASMPEIESADIEIPRKLLP
jgi:hypothetical protein